jgi:hypothetical protein
VVIGVQTPELTIERDTGNPMGAVREQPELPPLPAAR